MEAQKKINAYLVAGGKYHDIDFARLEILKLLAEDERIRTKVGQDYKDIDAITASDFIITYTCDVVPSLGLVNGAAIVHEFLGGVVPALEEFCDVVPILGIVNGAALE